MYLSFVKIESIVYLYILLFICIVWFRIGVFDKYKVIGGVIVIFGFLYNDINVIL